MAVLINQENVTGQLNLDASASLLQDLDEYSVLVEWAPQATTGIDTLWGHAANAANNYGVSMQVADNGDSTYNFRATLKGDTDLTAGETPTNETSPTITVPTATVIRATALFRSAGNYEIYANGLSGAQAISPAIEPLSNYNLDTVRINSINGSTSFAGTTAKLYVIDRIVDAGEIAAWESSATVPDSSSGPAISSISNFRAGETATITVDSYDTVSGVTVDGSAQADVVEATATTITFTVDSDGFLPGSDVDVVVTDANGASAAYAETYNLPTGFTGVTLTSVGAAAFGGVAIGDHLATNSAKYVAQADGSVSVIGSPVDGETYTILLYDASASYAVLETLITIEVETTSTEGLIKDLIQPLINPLINDLIR